MRPRPNYLFSEGDLRATLESHKESALKKIAGIEESRLRNNTVEELEAQLLEEYLVHPLLLDKDSVKKSVKEVQIDVSGDTNRYIRDRSRPFNVNGYEYRCEYRYSGDSLLWKLRPSNWSSVLPVASAESDAGGRNGVITFTTQAAGEANPAQLVSAIDRELQTTEQYIAWQSSQIESFNRVLGSSIGSALKDRFLKIQSANNLAKALGASFASSISGVADSQPASQVIKPSRKAPKRTLASKQHDLFISHASEDKDGFVRPLTAALRQRGIDVWLDEAELKLGDSLRRKIDQGLAGSKFGLVVLSKSFFAKSWPQYELDGLVAREVDGQKVILPIWLGLTRQEVANFSPTLSDRLAADAATKSIEQIADEIVSALK